MTQSEKIRSLMAQHVFDLLHSHQILDDLFPYIRNDTRDEDDDFLLMTRTLHTLVYDLCDPPISIETCRDALQFSYKASFHESYSPLPPAESHHCPDPPMIRLHSEQPCRIVRLLLLSSSTSNRQQHRMRSSTSKSKPIPLFLQLPVPFILALLRILTRALSNESEEEYNRHCLFHAPFYLQTHANAPTSTTTSSPSYDADHISRRPQMPYSVARFACHFRIRPMSETTEALVDTASTPVALATILDLWEYLVVAIYSSSATTTLRPNNHTHDSVLLLAPLARLMGVLATAGLTTAIWHRLMTWAQSAPPSLPIPPPWVRWTLVRALKTATLGSARSSLVWSKVIPPKQYFCFPGQDHLGLQRTINGLMTWPFRNDFGMALWFRAERLEGASSSKYPILFRIETDDGGGIEVSIVPLVEPSTSTTAATTTHSSSASAHAAYTIAIAIYDSQGHPCGDTKPLPAHRLVAARNGCVLLPHVWYHLAIRHTRARMKGVFSMSAREQVSILLDGKSLLTEALPFPKISDTDFGDSASSILKLRRVNSHSSMNITISFGSYFAGQTGALYVLNDSVSDATFRALYELSGGNASGAGKILKRTHSLGESWDARRSDLVRKSRVLDIKMKLDDAEEIVLSQRRTSGFFKQRVVNKVAVVVDLAEGEDHQSTGGDTEPYEYPLPLQRSLFGSKIFLTWDPRRSSNDSLAFELHIGAHVNMNGVYSWGFHGAQDVISSFGGVQSLIPLFRSFLTLESYPDKNEDLVRAEPHNAASAVTPDLIRLLVAFVQDHNDNARELLRCGGIDVLEQLLLSCKKLAMGKGAHSLFSAINVYPRLAQDLVDALLELRMACSHYVSLETKVYSRVLFNMPLWLGSFSQIPGAALHTVLLPALSSLTQMNPEKVRDCVGIRDVIVLLKEYNTPPWSTDPLDNSNCDRFVDKSEESLMLRSSLSHIERRRASNILLGMMLAVLSSGVTPLNFSAYLDQVSFLFDNEADVSHLDTTSALSENNVTERRVLTVSMCTMLLLLLQLRPVVDGLYESFANVCGGVHSGASWILMTMINVSDDEIRSIGIRCLAAYLDVANCGADMPLALGSVTKQSASNPEMGHDVSSTVRRASTRITQIAKGFTSHTPSYRPLASHSSKLTARVVFKLLWHLLKSHRYHLGDLTHSALLEWITSDDEISSVSLARVDFLLSHMTVKIGTSTKVLCFDLKWATAAIAEASIHTGKLLHNPLAIGTVLRLLRFLDNDRKDQWLLVLLRLTKSSRKCVSMLSSLSEWQPCLFHLISETLELLTVSSSNGNSSHPAINSMVHGMDHLVPKSRECNLSTDKRLDLCLQLYASLLGHLLRTGGDRALEAVERVAALQRMSINGNHVLILVLSNLCGDIFENGTLLDVGSLSAQDWEDLDLELESVLLKQSAKLITDAILSKGTKGLDLNSAVRSWRSIRHLTEVVVAIITKSGFGIVELFDYRNHQASSVDGVSGGLHGIRLSDSRLKGIGGSEYASCVPLQSDGSIDRKRESDIDRRLCVALSAQMLTLLDSFIFPDSLNAALPGTQVDGLALVRFSEARLGSSQGPLISAAIRLSIPLLGLLEPCSITFLQCSSRLRCLLCWALELLREHSTPDVHPISFHVDGEAHLDRLILAVTLHCHRALGRCSSLLWEIETTPPEKYFHSRDAQKKYHRRLLRVALELRDVVSTAFRGRNDLLLSTMSMESFEALRVSLEGDSSSEKNSKESVVREFLSSSWVTGFTDIVHCQEIVIPEQVSMETIPLSSEEASHPHSRGFFTVEMLANESKTIVSDFETAINSCFEEYLQGQRAWAETDAVRDLEYDGDSTSKRLSENHKLDNVEFARVLNLRRNIADSRWRAIHTKVVEPWRSETHWKLAKYTDVLGRRTVLVQNREFRDHHDASYDLAMGKEREKEEIEREKRLLAKNDLTDVIRRNAAAFTVEEALSDADSRDDGSLQLKSDGDSTADMESSTDGDSIDNMEATLIQNSLVHEGNDEHDEGWDKIDTEEIQEVDDEGGTDSWATAFIWADSESIVARFEPVMIVSLQTFVEGKILLTTHGLYFHQLGDEINAITREPVESPDGTAVDNRDKRWRLARLTEVHGRRFMHRPQALELFFSDNHELLLNFPGGCKDRDRFHSKLRHNCKVPMLWSFKSLNPKIIYQKSKYSELWKKRKISNFEYLMALNRMAGRSFNDLSQYPVFPWVLCDYSSDSIDLCDPRVYRDLSKPVGALNSERLDQLLERYNELELFGFAETEKFLYGSHYSSPGIVLHFLIRQEPFTTMAIDLQSGRFDCPDRLFFDIGESWKSCLTSTSDVKELIPECFCLPEMFLNTNKYPLGRTQSGRQLDDVGLPPWAKGSAYEFVRIHRLALESDFVSQNLHHWIDLIFGYKQRGPEALTAHNIFHHLSYEGSVDLSKIADDIDRNAAESHIQNFGQTPSQLLTEEPHPQRYIFENCWKPLFTEISSEKIFRCNTPANQFSNKRGEYAKGSVLKLQVFSDFIVAVYADMTIGTYKWIPTNKTNRLRMEKVRPFARRELSTSRVAMKRGSAISPEQMEKCGLAVGNWSIGISMGGLAKEIIRRNTLLSSGRLMSGSEMSLSSAEAAALVVTCGNWDETIKAFCVDGSRVLASETGGHRGAIRCLALAHDSGLLVTGGQDGTVCVWVVDHPDMSIALSDGYVQTALGGSIENDLLSCCHCLWGHSSPIICCALDSNIDVVVSGSETGLFCVHTLRRGEFIRTFEPPAMSKDISHGSAMKVALGSEGNMVVQMEDMGLHALTVNAVRLCSVDAGEHLHDMKICSMDEILITGGDRCRVTIRRLYDLQVLTSIDLTRHGPVRCIALTPSDLNPIEQCLFVGSDDGMITIIDEDPAHLRKDSPMTSL